MPKYIALVQVTTEHHVAVVAKNSDAAYDKVKDAIDNDDWKRYAVESEDADPEINLIEVEEADLDTYDLTNWIK